LNILLITNFRVTSGNKIAIKPEQNAHSLTPKTMKCRVLTDEH